MSNLDDIAAEARRELGAPADMASVQDAGGAAGPEVLPPLSDLEKQEQEAREWSALPFLFGRIVSRVMPELLAVYTEAACLEWGRSMVPVARKYGWTLGGASIFLDLGMTSWALLGPTFEAIKRKRAAPAAPAQPEQTPQAAAPEVAPDETTTRTASPETHPDGSPKT